MLSANVVLVAPRLMSLAAPLDPTNGERAGIIDECQALAADVGVRVTVLYCACHRRDDIVHQMLGRSALVIVGGRSRVWWPSAEQRLVERLIGQGYPVVFADVRAARGGVLAPSRALRDS